MAQRAICALLLLVRAQRVPAGNASLVQEHASRRLIAVEGATAQDASNIDPDDFLWEKLPGRCCFYGGPDPEDKSKWLGAHTCDECTVWDLPNNYCHTSPAACLECGMRLYCDPTPPLVSGNKVCIGPSRVGHGCDDTLGTGVCATHSLRECQTTCRHHPRCEMLVFYPQEKQGTCILCADLTHYQDVTLESTRVYSVTPDPPPPASPRGVEHHYVTLDGPSPPPPPKQPPAAPSNPPHPLDHLGRQHTRQHFECTYQLRTELSVDQSEGYADRIAASKEECCNFCGTRGGCQDFVFEPGSGTCVLLPHVSSDLIIKTPNEYTVAGSLQITIVKKTLERHGECEYTPSSGYAGGNLGDGQPLPGGTPIDDKVDCCDACDRTPSCTKFTFEPYSKRCVMYEGYAETFLTDSLLSGKVVKRTTVGSSSILGVGTEHAGGGEGAAAGAKGQGSSSEEVPAWMMHPPPPMWPLLNFLVQIDPPPAPPPEMGDAASSVIAGVSMTLVLLMGLALSICVYCFFREEVLAVAAKASGSKRKKKGAYGSVDGHVPSSLAEGWPDVEPDEEHTDLDQEVDGEAEEGGGGRSSRQPRRTSRKGSSKREPPMKGAEVAGVGGLAPGYCVRVRLEMNSLSQKKEVHVGEQAKDLAQLREVIWAEFSALKGKRAEEMLILCEGAEGSAAPWNLVTRDSDFVRVLGRASLKVIDKPPPSAEKPAPEFEVAFPKALNGEVGGRANRRKGKVRSGGSNGEGGRFADEVEQHHTGGGNEAVIAPGGNGVRFVDDD